VALKMLRPHLLEQAEMGDRFRQEAQAAAVLQHPGILPVYQVGESDGIPWFSMMLAEGGTLAARRDQFTGNWRKSAALIANLARAVGFAHERGVLHRDLKPGNILFDAEDWAYVWDFGLAKVATPGETTPDLTQSIQLLGTPHYKCPG
jgi:serine/threonine protein kinase